MVYSGYNHITERIIKMTVEEVKNAIKNHSIVQFKTDSNKWGFLTCLSDDESIAYFHPKGCGFIKIGVLFNQIELG